MQRRFGTTSRWDPGTHRDLATRPLDLPPGVAIRWTGASGFLISAGSEVLAVDPYLTRIGLRDLVGTRPVHGDPTLAAGVLESHERLVGTVVGHTHIDHVLDVPTLLRHHGGPAFGSTSLRRLLDLHGLAESAVVVEPHRHYEVGPFTVRFVPSRHAPLVAGIGVPFAGELTCEHLDDLGGRRYRCGDVFGIEIEIDGTRIYHQGSADFIEDELEYRSVDVFLAGIAGRNSAPGYFPKVLRRLDPRQIVPTHYDNFLRPARDGDLPFLPGVNLSGFIEQVGRLAPDAALVALDLDVPDGG